MSLHLLTWHLVGRAAGLLGDCVGIYFASLVVWTLLRGSRPRHARRWMRFIASLRRFKEQGTLRLNEIFAAVVFASFCLVFLGFQSRNIGYPIVVEHNVVVKYQQPDGDWVMQSDEDPSLVFRPCADDIAAGIDVNGLLTESKGFIAERAIWEERGRCKSIERADLGFWFKDRENDFTYRTAN